MEAKNEGLSEDLRRMKRNRARKIVNRIKSVVNRKEIMSRRSLIEKCGLKSGFSSTQTLIQNYSNFKESGVPIRFMYYMNGTWIGFPREVFESLKDGFMEGRLMLDVLIEGSKFLFDFLRMLQVDLVTGNRRSISWIDVNKKCFFPKLLTADDDEISRVVPEVLPKVVFEIRIDNSRKRKRNESDSDDSSDSDSESSGESSSVVESSIPPKKPRIQTSVFERSNWPNVEILKEGDRNYMDVKNIFVSGLKKIDQSVNVTSICRCMHKGPLGSVRSQLFQKQIELTKAARGVANLKLAWHGTSSEGVANILSHGFGITSKISGSQPYGVGIYLSPGQSPETSVLVSDTDHNGEKHALLCRVIMGSVEKVEEGSDQFHPTTDQFDTGVDDISNPRWYIVWSTHMNRHIFPEYVVSYKTSDHLQEGLLREASLSKRTTASTSIQKRTTALFPKRTAPVGMHFVELFHELKSSLPSSKFQELEQVFRIYKERKMSKDAMIKHLRSIAGDKLIVSTIHKIRSRNSK